MTVVFDFAISCGGASFLSKGGQIHYNKGELSGVVDRYVGATEIRFDLIKMLFSIPFVSSRLFLFV